MTETETVSHININIVAHFHKPMYLMQKYWARKPPNVVAEYIKHYSKEGETVLDPFLGSGVTVIEALHYGRKGIGFDLNPFSLLLAQTTIDPPDLEQLEAQFENLRKELEEPITKLYPATCPKCHKHGQLYCIMWAYVVNCPTCNKRLSMANAKRPKGKKQNIYKCPYCKQDFSYASVAIVDEEPVSLRLNCPTCKKKYRIKDPKLKIPKVDTSTVWYPQIKFEYGTDRHFMTRRRARTIEELFTERNLYALSLINSQISQIEDEKNKRTFQFIFASMVPQASKMMILTETSGPSWKVPEYLIYPVHGEFNVWTRFYNRYQKITSGLKDRNSTLPSGLKVANDFADFSKANSFISQLNAVEVSSVVPLESVDYVFTDPPYGGAIQYFELDMIRVAWLLGKEKWADALSEWQAEEITINTGQHKNFDYYHKMLVASFTEVFKVLKPNRYLTVTFHSAEIDVWNSIIIAVRLCGFELEKILYQSPAVASAKQSLQPWGSAVGDYYIRFRRPPRKETYY